MREKRNVTILQLSEWAADPARMERFTALCKLSQRVSFIREVLSIDDVPDSVIRMQVAMVCDRNGIAFIPKRGKSYRGIHAKSLSFHQRLHGSYLLSKLFANPSSGLTVEDSGIVAHRMLDRLIHIFNHWMNVFGFTAEDAPVNFEQLYFLYTSYTKREVEMNRCLNCDGLYLNLRISRSGECPLCTQLNLARWYKPAHSGPVLPAMPPVMHRPAAVGYAAHA